MRKTKLYRLYDKRMSVRSTVYASSDHEARMYFCKQRQAMKKGDRIPVGWKVSEYEWIDTPTGVFVGAPTNALRRIIKNIFLRLLGIREKV